MLENETETTLEKKKKGRKPKTNNYFDVKCGEGVIRILETNRLNYFKVNQYL